MQKQKHDHPDLKNRCRSPKKINKYAFPFRFLWPSYITPSELLRHIPNVNAFGLATSLWDEWWVFSPFLFCCVSLCTTHTHHSANISTHTHTHKATTSSQNPRFHSLSTHCPNFTSASRRRWNTEIDAWERRSVCVRRNQNAQVKKDTLHEREATKTKQEKGKRKAH